MQICVRVKTIGKKKNILPPSPYEIADGISTLRQLLTEIVRSEVEAYNAKETGAQIIPFLTKEELEGQAEAGKVSFGRTFRAKRSICHLCLLL